MSTIEQAPQSAFENIHGQIKAFLQRSEQYRSEAEGEKDINEGEKHARVSSVLKELDRLATAFKEREDDYNAFSLTPAMVQARNDRLNNQVDALKARAAKLEEALREVLSGCKRCGGDGATLERPWVGAEHELNSCPDCGKYRELLSSPAAREEVSRVYTPSEEIDAAQAHMREARDNRWISVDDRLPEEGDTMILFGRIARTRPNGTRFVMEAQTGWQRDGRWWSDRTDNYGRNLEISDVTHWRELPPPPTEGGAL